MEYAAPTKKTDLKTDHVDCWEESVISIRLHIKDGEYRSLEYKSFLRWVTLGWTLLYHQVHVSFLKMLY